MTTQSTIAVFSAYTSNKDNDDENYYLLSSFLSSNSTHQLINFSQYKDLISCIQELKTQREGATYHETLTIRGITLRSVLSCVSEGLSDEPALSLRATSRILSTVSISTDHKNIVKS